MVSSQLTSDVRLVLLAVTAGATDATAFIRLGGDQEHQFSAQCDRRAQQPDGSDLARFGSPGRRHDHTKAAGD